MSIGQTKWVERTFKFDYPAGLMPGILERLRGTALRIREMVSNLPDATTEFKPDGAWSIKEHIGHLADLEKLHDGRIDDFLARKEVLRAADMTNTETERANHNESSIEQLLKNFSTKREAFIIRLEQLDDQTQLSVSLHPRLQVLMRPVDMACFTAEHDDHHLAAMRALVRKGSAVLNE